MDIDNDFKQEVSRDLSEHDKNCGVCINSYSNESDILNGEISFHEVNRALKSMTCGKAPGPCGFVVEFFKEYNRSNIIAVACKVF